MRHRLRKVLIRPGRELLSGVVEVNETYIGGEEPGLVGGRAKGKKDLVAVAVEVTPPHRLGRSRMQLILVPPQRHSRDSCPKTSPRALQWSPTAGTAEYSLH